jgi:hypothetical protein
VTDQTDRPPGGDAPPERRDQPAAPIQPPPGQPDRKSPAHPGEASPGGVPAPRDAADEPQARPFSQFMIEQRRGALHAELSDVLREVVAAVQDHGKAGSLTLTIDVKPGAKGTRTLVVSDSIKTKIPQGERPSALFFADDAGNLHRDDPTQPELPLRRVDVGRGADDDLRRAAQ